MKRLLKFFSITLALLMAVSFFTTTPVYADEVSPIDISDSVEAVFSPYDGHAGDVFDYDGTEKVPVVHFTYLNKELVPGVDYDIQFLNAVEPGNYGAEAVFKGQYTGYKMVFYSIAAPEISVLLDKSSYTYTGSAIVPKVTVKRHLTANNSNIVINPSKYTVSVKNNINAGTGTVTVSFNDSYFPTTTKNFTIAKRSSGVSMSLSGYSYTYNGKKKSPTVTVKTSNGKVLKNGTDYTLTVPSGRTNIGQYTYKVVLKGNYSGTLTRTLTIRPVGTSVSKITSGLQSLKVTWKKKTSRTNGYQIQYAYNSKFNNAKSVTIGNNKTVAKTLSGLGNYKTVYVRIRTFKTVGKTKIYSNWSKVVSKKTKGVPAVSNFKASAGYYQIKTSWKKNASVNGYKISYATKSDFSNAKTITIKKNSTTSYSINKLSGNKKYYVRIRGYKVVNKKTYYSNWSAVKTITTKYYPAPAVPTLKTRIISKTNTPFSVKGTWNSVKGATGYQVVLDTYNNVTVGKEQDFANVRLRNGGPLGKPINITGTSYTFKKLKDNKTYVYFIRSYKKYSTKTVYSKWTAVGFRTRTATYTTYMTAAQKQDIYNCTFAKFHDCTKKYYGKDVKYVFKEVKPGTSEAASLKKNCLVYYHGTYSKLKKGLTEAMDPDDGFFSVIWMSVGDSCLIKYMWENIDGETYLWITTCGEV